MTRKIPPHFVIETHAGQVIGCRSIDSDIETSYARTLDGGVVASSSRFVLIATDVLYGSSQATVSIEAEDIACIQGSSEYMGDDDE